MSERQQVDYCTIHPVSIFPFAAYTTDGLIFREGQKPLNSNALAAEGGMEVP